MRPAEEKKVTADVFRPGKETWETSAVRFPTTDRKIHVNVWGEPGLLGPKKKLRNPSEVCQGYFR